MIKIEDNHKRTFKTLRVSLTNICNLACAYCVDPTAKESKNKNTARPLLSCEEYISIIDKIHALTNLETIRLTGGEPTLYKELIPLIEGIRKIGIQNIKMTSNATLLKQKAQNLKKAGLTSVNISLDAVDPELSFKMNKRKNFKNILDGIESAMNAGIQVKVNSVIMKNLNDTHLMELFEFCKRRNIRIRFLELMEMGHLHQNFENYFVSQSEILTSISTHYEIKPQPRTAGSTANYWTTNDGFTFGIVGNVSAPFCNDCNRLRLDSYGSIYGCLSNNTPIPVKEYLQDEEELRQKLFQALYQKKTRFSGSKLSMLHIGG